MTDCINILILFVDRNFLYLFRFVVLAVSIIFSNICYTIHSRELDRDPIFNKQNLQNALRFDNPCIIKNVKKISDVFDGFFVFFYYYYYYRFIDEKMTTS